MKAVVLDGSLPGDPAAGRVRDVLAGRLGKAGWEIRCFGLSEMKIAPCQGCFRCWTQTPGQCPIEDDSRKVARAFVNADLVVFFTPVTFGGYGFHLKKTLDRLICVVSPFFTKVSGEIHHKKRYVRYPRLLGIGLTASSDREAERVFKSLVRANSLNLHAPAQHAVVVSTRHGEDVVAERISDSLSRLEVNP